MFSGVSSESGTIPRNWPVSKMSPVSHRRAGQCRLNGQFRKFLRCLIGERDNPDEMASFENFTGVSAVCGLLSVNWPVSKSSPGLSAVSLFGRPAAAKGEISIRGCMCEKCRWELIHRSRRNSDKAGRKTGDGRTVKKGLL